MHGWSLFFHSCGCLCDSAAAPARAALSSQVLPSRALDNAGSVCAGRKSFSIQNFRVS